VNRVGSKLELVKLFKLFEPSLAKPIDPNKSTGFDQLSPFQPHIQLSENFSLDMKAADMKGLLSFAYQIIVLIRQRPI
jgi:hypothetical protein